MVLGPQISKDDRIVRFFKGVFRLRPTLPKYDITWDPALVLGHLSSKFPNEDLNLEVLTKKCITLLSLVTAQRVQTLSKINIKNIENHQTELVIKIPDLIKTSRPGRTQPVLTLPFFIEKIEICPAKTLLDYINVTNSLRSSDILFISFKKPHNSVSTQTLSRWIKQTLKESGIDVSVFTAHSTRHASSSKAYRSGVNIDLIRKTAGWSTGSNTFWKFYNRNLLPQNQTSLARAILSEQ